MQARATLMWLMLLSACGRLSFDASERAGPDAAPDAPPLVPLHQYSFISDLADDNGMAPLTSAGGTLTTAGYRFGRNQGLRVSGAMPAYVYTVDVLFSFEELGSWRKILDFKGLTSDNGFYTFDERLQFVVVAGSVFQTSPPLITSNTMVQVTLTRDQAGTVIGYVNRTPQFTFMDTGGVAALAGVDAEAIFFIDDNPTGGNEASGGVVRRIRIYDVALTAEQLQP